MIRKFMRPEFLNRIDEIVMFKPLTKEQIHDVVEIQVSGLIQLLSTRGISLSVKKNVISWLAEKGYDPQLGARPVKRLIQREILDKLSKEIIAGNILKEDNIIMDIKDGAILILNGSREKS
jgi:ATP-dependent Clp protease ATP-binding subunit ClpB